LKQFEPLPFAFSDQPKKNESGIFMISEPRQHYRTKQDQIRII